MSNKLCKGGCGQEATFKEWCGIKWQSGNKYAVSCPVVEQRRGISISKYRVMESSIGKNPMQNPEICAKNHSLQRAKKISEKLRRRGNLGILPQQVESKELKEKRRMNVSQSMRKLWEQGLHPRQKETYEQKIKRMQNVSKGISEKIRRGEVSPSYGKVKPGEYQGILFRSQWEIKTAEFLDKYGFSWEYEAVRIEYFDSTRQRNANTVPDFYLPGTGVILEVKGRWLESQQTKDKLAGIRASGFATVLIGEKEITLMDENPYRVIKLIEGAEL